MYNCGLHNKEGPGRLAILVANVSTLQACRAGKGIFVICACVCAITAADGIVCMYLLWMDGDAGRKRWMEVFVEGPNDDVI